MFFYTDTRMILSMDVVTVANCKETARLDAMRLCTSSNFSTYNTRAKDYGATAAIGKH